MSEVHLPPQGPSWKFEDLRTEVQADLLSSDGVLSLVTDTLRTSDDGRLPGFALDVHYAFVDQALLDEGERAADYLGVSLRITHSEKPVDKELGELALGFSIFDYIEIGCMRYDGSGLKLFDVGGRLHSIPRTDDGTYEFDTKVVPKERAEALMGWQAGHNKLLRASRQHPEMHISEAERVWTAQIKNYSSIVE
jgi:hypothetical protein